MAVLLLLAAIAIALCSDSAGNLLGELSQVERMVVAGIAVVAIMGVGTDVVIRRSDR